MPRTTHSAPTARRTPHAALFSTCLVDQILPEVGIATVTLLERLGLEVVFPPGQTCCGQPFFNTGLRTEALRLVKRTIEILEPYETIVIPSGSCTAMMRVEYPHLFDAEPGWQARAQALAEKTFELSESLVRMIAPKGRFSEWANDHLSGRSTSHTARRTSHVYHDSCHMCRRLGLREEPRAAMRAAGLHLLEMKEPDRCCGFGGLFSLKLPEVSAAITQEKLDEAARTAASILVTADPGCLIHMRRQAGNTGLRIEHLAVILEEATR